MTTFMAVFVPVGWIGVWIVGSIIYRRILGKPLIPRAPDNAVFAEAWRSGRSLKNVLSRFGGARNCLLVYVADGALTIVPIFPFNLMFLPEIFGLETTASTTDISAASVDGLFGRRLLLTIAGPSDRRFELWLRDQQAFRDALDGKRGVITKDTPAARSRASWRLILFRVFAVVWGAGAAVAGVAGLAQDISFRTHGEIAAGRIVGSTAARGDMGVLQYDVDGRAYTLTPIRGPGTYKIGDLEKVRYMPSNPASAREEDYLGFDLLFAGLGSFMLLLALTIGRIIRAVSGSMNV